MEARRLSQSQNGEQLNQESVENVLRTPPLPFFVDGKDNLDEYLLRFERYDNVVKWNRSTWATQLSPLLTGKAVEVYNRLSPEEEMDYERLNLLYWKDMILLSVDTVRNFEKLDWKDTKAQLNLYSGYKTILPCG